jgi:hypothetical protein
MKQYKIEIRREEVKNGNNNHFYSRSKEEVMFQILLHEDEVDMRAVLKQIVAGKGEPNERTHPVSG